MHSKIKYYIFVLMQLLRKLGFPISLVYGLVVYLRNWLYDRGILKSKSFKTPTICIGNLSVGGTGKTPMVEFLISALSNTFTIAILSRGYGRKTKGYIVASPEMDAEILGDEPFQIHSKFPKVPLAVVENRATGIAALESTIKPYAIILDDAFQHRKVQCTFYVLLTTYDALYTKDYYIPVGNLRDSKKESKRANVIVVTKCPPNLSMVDRNKVQQIVQPLPHQQLLFSSLTYDKNLVGDGNTLTLKDLKNKNITLITGIADPKPLIIFLEQQGIHIEHLRFKDHHFFTRKEIETFNTKTLVITTEKDYMRLKHKVESLYYIAIRHEFLEDGDTVFVNQISAAIKNHYS